MGEENKEKWKQSIIATSTIIVELCHDLRPQFMNSGCENISQGFGLSTCIKTKPLRIYGDDFAVVFFWNDEKYMNDGKHIRLKYFSIKEEVQKHRVSFEHIRKI